MRPGVGRDGSPKTVVVIGAARGGTSFVAECLVRLGVPMGPKYGNARPTDGSGVSDYVNYEDVELVSALEDVMSRGLVDDPSSNEWRYFRQLVQDRDLAHDLWGFKRPQAVFAIDQLLPLLRNPHLVLVMRDPVAVWTSQQARNVSGRATWGMARHAVGCVMDLAEKPRGPTLALSFERAKEAPAVTRYMMAKFLGLTPSEEDACEYLSQVSQGTSAASSQGGSSGGTPLSN